MALSQVTVLENLDGHTIYVTAPLQFTHRAEIVTIEGRTIDLRGEVGLLTRNIVVQGDSNSEDQQYGVHNVAMMSGIFRYENIEVRCCGQAFNFGVYTRRSSALLISDRKPAVFWTSTPENYWYNNVGTNSMGQGHWFELPDVPGGGDNDVNVCPVHSYLGGFVNNTWDLHFVNCTLLENGYTYNPAFKDGLFIGRLPGSYDPQEAEYYFMEGSTFVNYGKTPLITGCNECLNGENMAQGGFTYRTKRLKFVNSTKILTWSPNYKEIFWDLDGSMAGEPNSMIVKHYSFISWPNDTKPLDLWKYEDALLVHSHTRARRVEIDKVTPDAQLAYT
eukprot:gene36437-biopygen5441